MNECYVKSKGWWSQNTLVLDIMKGQQHITTIELMHVGTAEIGLDAGRFENFSREEQAHKVSIRMVGSGDDTKRRFHDLITWIETQPGVWSFEPVYESIGKMNVIFSFADVTTAVTFKLVWF